MADYTLSTANLGKPVSTGGLKADLINGQVGGSLATGRIDANAGQIRYMNANIPKQVQDQTSTGLQHFMGTTAEAAFQYQDREASYWANEAEMAYSVRAGDIYQKFEEVKGAQTKKGFEVFEKALDESFDDIMGNLDPRTQQKAIFQMQSAKQRFRMQGATHRTKEFEKAVVQQQSRLSSQYGASWALNPTLIDAKDPHTGLSGRQTYFALYPEDHAKALEKYTSTILETGKQIFYNEENPQEGIRKMNEFWDKTASQDLLSAPAKRRQMQEFMDATPIRVAARAEGVRKKVNDIADREIKDNQLAMRVWLYEQTADENLIPEEQLNAMVGAQTLAPTDRDVYVRQFHRNDASYSLPKFREYEAIAKDPRITSRADFVPPWHGDPFNMNWTKQGELDKLMRTALDFNKNGELETVFDAIESEISRGFKVPIVTDGPDGAYKRAAEDYAMTLFEGREFTAEQIGEMTIKKFSRERYDFDEIPPLSSADGSPFKPKSLAAVDAHRVWLDGSSLSASEQKAERKILTRWNDFYGTKEAAAAEVEKAESIQAEPTPVQIEENKQIRDAAVEAETLSRLPPKWSDEKKELYIEQAQRKATAKVEKDREINKEKAIIEAQRIKAAEAFKLTRDTAVSDYFENLRNRAAGLAADTPEFDPSLVELYSNEDAFNNSLLGTTVAGKTIQEKLDAKIDELINQPVPSGNEEF